MKRLLHIMVFASLAFSCEKLDIVRVEAQIESIQPSAAVPGSTIAISGSNFTNDAQVTFDNMNAEIVSTSDSKIEVIIPFSVSVGMAEISVDDRSAPAVESIAILPYFVKKTPHPDGAIGGAGFVLGNTLYFGGAGKPFYKYNPASDTWTPMNPNNTSPQKTGAIGASVNGKGYILATGNDGELWEYDPVANDWTQKNGYPNGQLIFPAVLVIGTNLYLVTGFQNFISRQVWRYSTINDEWTQLNDYDGVKRGSAVGFVIDGTGYVGQGYDFDTNSFLNDFYSYNAVNDSWTEIAAPLQPSANLEGGLGFSIGNKGYIGLGRNGTSAPIKDFWKYDSNSDSWRQFATYPGNGVMEVLSYVVGNKVYLMNGSSVDFSEDYIEMWEFTPETL